MFLLSRQIYISDYIGLEIGYDITFFDGDIWMANDNTTSPIGRYEQASGAVLDRIAADIGIGSEIRGVTCETGTVAPYLWVSNQTKDELYRIDLFTGIASEPALPDPYLSLSSNPFYSSVVITGSGFSSTSILEIHDIAGRIVASSSFGGIYTWNAAELPTGAYILTVSDSEANRESIKILKL